MQGGASGFGKALATRIVKLGGFVVLGDTNISSLSRVANHLNDGYEKKAIYAECDVRKKDDLERLLQKAIDEWNGFDVLVNCAGITEKDQFISDSEDSWIQVVRVDLEAVILGTRMAIKHFLDAQKSGVVINISSLAGLYPQPLQPVYAAAKAGVVSFTQSLGYLGQDANIRVNAICPSYAKTLLTKDLEGLVEKWITVDQVVEAILLGIQDTSLSGSIIRITPEYGIDIVRDRKRGQTAAKI